MPTLRVGLEFLEMWTNNKPKTDYALILFCCNHGYLPGANAILNAMDYYENKMDLHLIYDNLPGEYLESLRVSDLNYRIEARALGEVLPMIADKYRNEKWVDYLYRLMWTRIWYMIWLADKYKVTGLIDGDALLLNNITPWFRMVEGTGYLATAYHSFHGLFLENYNESLMRTHVPLFMTPCICEPGKWLSTLEMVMQLGRDGITGNEMEGLNRAILLSGNRDRVFVLTDIEWLEWHVFHFPIRSINLDNGKRYVFSLPTNIRANVLHGRWYSRGFRDSHAANNGVLISNFGTLINEYRFFNESWKVKLFPSIVDKDWLR